MKRIVVASIFLLILISGCTRFNKFPNTKNLFNDTLGDDDSFKQPPTTTNVSGTITINQTANITGNNQTTNQPTNQTPNVSSNTTNTNAINQTITNQTLVNQTTSTNQTLNQTTNQTIPYAPSEPEGLIFSYGEYSLVLDDVAVVTSDERPCGIFSIHDLRGEKETVIDQMVLCPGETKYWLSPGGDRFRIVIIEVAAGYTKETQWAKAIIYG